MRGVDAGMTNKEAKQLLMAMGCDVTPDQLALNGMEYVLSGEDVEMSAVLDGRFTKDHLIAIARWMRDPEGVANA